MELFKLHVENLGRIKQAELSIRPLTVFVGPNNTNKTWTAYALYGLAKWLSWESAKLRPFVESDLISGVDVDLKVGSVVQDTVNQEVTRLSAAGEDALVLAEVGREGMLKKLSYPVSIRLTPAGLGELLAVSEEHFQDSRVCLEFDEVHLSSAPLDTVSLKLTERSGPVCSMMVARRRGGKPVSGWTRYEAEGSAQGDFARSVVRMAAEFVLLGRFGQVVALPAERKGLIVVTDLLQEQEFREFLSQPVVDFVGLLRRATRRFKRREHLQQIPDMASLLEKRLLAGSLKVEGGETPLALLYDFGHGAPLRMHAASSLVRALAGLDLYLRYLAEPGDLIVIDEPEMNAHPEAQLMIAELLGILVNKGINVVITTHSPYIVDHINNLVEAAHLCEEKQKEIAGRFKLQTKDAFVPEENVATYEFHDDGQVTNVFDRGQRLIDWDTFGKVSDEVSKLFNDILVAAHEE